MSFKLPNASPPSREIPASPAQVPAHDSWPPSLPNVGPVPSSIDRPRPLVYVIVLNWNGWQETVRCLESLRQLDYPHFKVIVVDNASTDDSVARILRAYPDQTIIRNEQNLGYGVGNNVGIRVALQKGAEFIWLLNNDTRVHPGALSALVRRALANPDVGAVGSVLYYTDAPGRIQAWGGGSVNFLLGRCGHYIHPVPDDRLDYLTGASLLIRREALEQVGGFDPAYFLYWEDADLGFRLRRAGWKLAVAPDSIVWHKESASVGRGTPVQVYYFNRSAITFFSRRAPWPAWSIVTGTVIRFAKRLLLRDWTGAVAILRALRQRGPTWSGQGQL